MPGTQNRQLHLSRLPTVLCTHSSLIHCVMLCVLCPLMQLHTNRLEVPFYVKSRYEFDRQYPDRTPARTKMEHEVRKPRERSGESRACLR